MCVLSPSARACSSAAVDDRQARIAVLPHRRPTAQCRAAEANTQEMMPPSRAMLGTTWKGSARRPVRQMGPTRHPRAVNVLPCDTAKMVSSGVRVRVISDAQQPTIAMTGTPKTCSVPVRFVCPHSCCGPSRVWLNELVMHRCTVPYSHVETRHSGWRRWCISWRRCYLHV